MKLTPKQKVLRKYPMAYCWRRELPGYLVSNGIIVIAKGSSARQAWADAATHVIETVRGG